MSDNAAFRKPVSQTETVSQPVSHTAPALVSFYVCHIVCWLPRLALPLSLFLWSHYCRSLSSLTCLFIPSVISCILFFFFLLVRMLDEDRFCLCLFVICLFTRFLVCLPVVLLVFPVRLLVSLLAYASVTFLFNPLFGYPPFCFVCLSLLPGIFLLAYLLTCLPLRLPICLCFSTHLSVCLIVCSPACPRATNHSLPFISHHYCRCPPEYGELAVP